MFKGLLFLFLVCCVSLTTTTNVNAEYRFRDGSKIEIQWYEKEGVIINKHVCFNYKEDKKKYEQCREKAVDYFEEECDFYEDKIRTTPRKYRSMYEPEKNKFCSASENYQP